MIVVGLIQVFGEHKCMASHRSHGSEHGTIVDTTALQLLVDHAQSG
jgi:hypothetical protein